MMRYDHRRLRYLAAALSFAGAALLAPAALADRVAVEQRATQRLQIQESCQYNRVWTDKGSGAEKDVAIYRVVPPEGFFTLGDYAIATYKKRRVRCITIVRPDGANIEGGRRLLAPPLGWNRIWRDKGSGAKRDGSFWRATAPQGFSCLGDVGTRGYQAPAEPNYRCVNDCLVEPLVADKVVWTDRGSGARRDVSLYFLPNIRAFVAARGYRSSTRAADLKTSLSCAPTAQEIKLAEAEFGNVTGLSVLQGVLIGAVADGLAREDVVNLGDPIWASDGGAANKSAVSRIQAGLAKLDYDAGPIDGVMGRRSTGRAMPWAWAS